MDSDARQRAFEALEKLELRCLKTANSPGGEEIISGWANEIYAAIQPQPVATPTAGDGDTAHDRRIKAARIAALEARDDLIKVQSGLLDEMAGALAEAMEWNWMQDDVPRDVVQVCNETLTKYHALKQADGKDGAGV